MSRVFERHVHRVCEAACEQWVTITLIMFLSTSRGTSTEGVKAELLLTEHGPELSLAADRKQKDVARNLVLARRLDARQLQPHLYAVLGNIRPEAKRSGDLRAL